MKRIAVLNKEISGAPLRRVLLIVLGWIVFNTAKAQVPTAPDNFYVVKQDGQNELNWSANPGAENVTNYTVYRSLDKVTFTNVATVPAVPGPQYIDNNLTNGETYFYRLTATNASGEGPPSIIDAGVPGNDFGRFMEFKGVGSNDSVTFRNSDELQLANQSFTIELWLRIKNLPLLANEAHLITRYKDPGPPIPSQYETFCLRVLNTGQMEFRTYGGTTTKITTNTLNENEWYHVVLTVEYAGSIFVPIANVSIYVNGVLTTNTGSTPLNLLAIPASPGGALIVGAEGVPGPNFFEGYISELRIWDDVRTPVQITNDRCTMFRGDEAGLLGLWRFEEDGPSAPMVYDYTPNANNGGEDVVITNFKPETLDDFGATVENSSQDINIQDNDATTSTKPLVGTLLPGFPLSGNALLINNDSSITYTPDPGFYGIDTVKYFLSDTAVFCNTSYERDTAMVLVQVQCGNKDTLNWNDRPLAQAIDNRRIIERGLMADFEADDADNIQVEFATGNGFQNIRSMVWKQDPTTNIQASTTMISFNRPVDQFCLDILDIDSNPGNFTDSVVVNAYQDGNIVDLTALNLTPGAAIDVGANNSFTGNADVDDLNGTDGNLSICYFAPIDSIQIILTSTTSAPANPSEQGIGIGDFTWCAFANNPPVISNEDGTPVDSLFFTIAPDSLLNICLIGSDIDVDSLFISSIGTLSDGGIATVTNPSDTCLSYTAAANFEGTEYFRVVVCDNRPNQLCDEVVVAITTAVVPPPPPPPPPEPEPEPEPEGIFISQALSPNGDRILDHWEITGIEQYPNSAIKVFNIWGDLIFQQLGYDNQNRAWRGQTSEGNTIGGSVAPDGTYFYIIQLGDSQPLMKGYVVLKR